MAALGTYITPIMRLLRLKRESLGWSQAKLGRKVGYDHRQIHRWEQGHHQPGAKNLSDYAQALGGRLDYAEGIKPGPEVEKPMMCQF